MAFHSDGQIYSHSISLRKVYLMRALVLAACLACWLYADSAGVEAQMIVAHRGASHDAPENTVAAFNLAWEQEADAVEGDFYLTLDGRIACIHDNNTQRVTAKKSNLLVARSTLTDLQDLDVGSWKDRGFANQRVPSFEQVVETIPAGKIFFIEVKCGPEIIPALKKSLAESALPSDRTRIISFHEPVILAAKKLMPEIEAYWLAAFEYDKRTKAWSPSTEEVIKRAKAIGADGVDLEGNRIVVNQALVDNCHAAGLGVHVWTINDVDKAAYFQKLGVDSITTNRPALLRERLFPREQPGSHTVESIQTGGSP